MRFEILSRVTTNSPYVTSYRPLNVPKFYGWVSVQVEFADTELHGLSSFYKDDPYRAVLIDGRRYRSERTRSTGNGVKIRDGWLPEAYEVAVSNDSWTMVRP